MSEEEQVLEARAELGAQAELFIESDIGRYLVAKAEEVEASRKQQLAEVDPDNKTMITRLQSDIQNAQNFNQWIAELVLLGQDAAAFLNGPPE